MGKTGQKDATPTCKHNKGVCCSQEGDKCEKCGWNPAEHKRRVGKGLKTNAVQ